MKRYYLIFIIIVFIGCQDRGNRYIKVNESYIIKELIKKDFYIKFMHYNIRPREEGKVYMIESDTLNEFWVEFIDGKVTLLEGEENDFDKRLEKIYLTMYKVKKRTIIDELSELINFMIKMDIKYVVHYKESRIDFQLNNGNMLTYFDDTLLTKGLQLLKKYYEENEIVNMNWVISKKPILQ